MKRLEMFYLNCTAKQLKKHMYMSLKLFLYKQENSNYLFLLLFCYSNCIAKQLETHLYASLILVFTQARKQ
jgi:hypothetical protein